ncbi:hypothetical protein [Williamsia sp. CHRR-6]|uniref:hypothetical protein n=1 Tax=Williamsia sp. CHRR-6 TaxID=2835871 RepID=UPI001BDAC7E5|nr:hypothetical protein [Williamsia sp. CHRR-6]MBT0568605.1 hypothetical protein [Williamsia sp. CHRR-6]
MAAKSKAAGALEAYRREIISDGIEQRIAELSDAVAAYEANRADRKVQEKELAARQVRDEDALLVAFEEAKAAGAKPAALANIGLRPESALAAARARSARKELAPDEQQTDTAAVSPVSAIEPPLPATVREISAAAIDDHIRVEQNA